VEKSHSEVLLQFYFCNTLIINPLKFYDDRLLFDRSCYLIV
jgi:hypothetical protein